MKDFDSEEITIPQKLITELNRRAVHSMKINAEYAAKKHRDGEQWCISNTVDVAARAWLLYHVAVAKMTPSESMEAFVELATTIIFPAFLETPGMEKLVDADHAANLTASNEERDDDIRDALIELITHGQVRYEAGRELAVVEVVSAVPVAGSELVGTLEAPAQLDEVAIETQITQGHRTLDLEGRDIQQQIGLI